MQVAPGGHLKRAALHAESDGMRRALAASGLSAALFALAAGSPAPSAAQALVGGYAVQDGPSWTTSPPIYDCLEGCALVFGGAASDFACSTVDTAIDHQAFVSGWGDDTHCTTPVAEDFSVGTLYDDCGMVGCSYSAYVNDHCDAGQTNYCWLPDCGNGTLNPGEQCDDGNLAGGDCCSATCRLEAQGASCEDGDLCNGTETCDGAGTCLAGNPAVCEDGDPCSQDSCDPAVGCVSELAPSASCDEDAGGASLLVDGLKPRTSFAWKKGSVPLEDLGDPNAFPNDYDLCVYSGDSVALRLGVAAGTLCKGEPCWKPTRHGFRATIREGGFRSARLKAHDAGRAKLVFGGRGDGAGAIALPETGLTPPVTAQLFNRSGPCWSASFSAAAEKRNDGQVFKAKRSAP